MKKINLLIVNPKLFIGGAEVVIRNLCQHIDKNRFNVAICCLKEIGTIGEELLDDGFEVLCLPKPPDNKVDYLTSRKLVRIVREKNIDILHSHATQALVDSCLSKMFCTFSSAKPAVLHTFHCGEYPIPQKKRDLLERIFWRLADQLVAVGDCQKQQIQQTYNIANDRITTILNGVSPADSKVEISAAASFQQSNKVIIGTIGTLFEQKGITYLLDTAAELKKRGHEFIFIIAGEGPLRNELEAKRNALGLENDVLFLGWVTEASQNMLPHIDIFFQPSLWEAMSIVVLEAMMNQKPIVATKVGENEAVLDHEINGFLTDPRNINQMVLYLERFLVDDSLRMRMGSAARKKYEQYFTAEAMVKNYEKLYLKIYSERDHGKS